jgi:hypothetical protein
MAPETTKNSSYGTRSAKRKASGASGDSSGQKVSPTPSQRPAETREAKPPPSKKRSIQNIHKTPFPMTPAQPESDTSVLTVDTPSGSSNIYPYVAENPTCRKK